MKIKKVSETAPRTSETVNDTELIPQYVIGYKTGLFS